MRFMHEKHRPANQSPLRPQERTRRAFCAEESPTLPSGGLFIARSVASSAGKLAREAEERKAEAHLKGLAGAILGELEAYITLLVIQGC